VPGVPVERAPEEPELETEGSPPRPGPRHVQRLGRMANAADGKPAGSPVRPVAGRSMRPPARARTAEFPVHPSTYFAAPTPPSAPMAAWTPPPRSSPRVRPPGPTLISPSPAPGLSPAPTAATALPFLRARATAKTARSPARNSRTHPSLHPAPPTPPSTDSRPWPVVDVADQGSGGGARYSASEGPRVASVAPVGGSPSDPAGSFNSRAFLQRFHRWMKELTSGSVSWPLRGRSRPARVSPTPY
jgi:hypothetical protein